MGYPQVQLQMAEAFAKAWDYNGIKVIPDKVGVQFACDFANIVLKSFVDDLAVKAMAHKQKKDAAAAKTPTDAVAKQAVPPAAPQKSSIILTD